MSTEKIKYIADHYGYESQSRQCIEEMAELTQAINKLWRKGKTNQNNYKLLQNIYEEIADVQICLEQLKHLLNCQNEVEAMERYKLDREIMRIKKATKGGMKHGLLIRVIHRQHHWSIRDVCAAVKGRRRRYG